MSTANVAQLLALPADEKLQLMELLWESLMGLSGDMPLSDAHRQAIDEELEAHRQNPDDVLTLEELRAVLRGSL